MGASDWPDRWDEPKDAATAGKPLPQRFRDWLTGDWPTSAIPIRWYVPIAILGIVLGVALALDMASRVAGGLITQTEMVSFLVMSGVIIPSFRITVVKWWRVPLAVTVIHVLHAVYVIVGCGALFGWYVDRFALSADARTATEMILLVSFACVAGGAFALWNMHLWSRRTVLVWLVALFMAMLLATSVTSVYANFAELAGTIPAVLAACHLAYWFGRVASRPSNFERVLEISVVFVVDLTLMAALLLIV